MLKHLHIRNYTLIEELDIPFQPGFSVITGETGAGKSIILGAIGLLLGQRADAKTIKISICLYRITTIPYLFHSSHFPFSTHPKKVHDAHPHYHLYQQ